MSKKTRGAARNTRHRRPGARPAGSRPTSSRTVSRPESQAPVTSELATATDAGTLTAQESELSPTTERRPVVRSGHGRPRVKAGSLLAARAVTEYVYVAQDLKRISVVGVLLFGGLIALWLAIVVFRLVPLPFY